VLPLHARTVHSRAVDDVGRECDAVDDEEERTHGDLAERRRASLVCEHEFGH
jgi:hypothetical protein